MAVFTASHLFATVADRHHHHHYDEPQLLETMDAFSKPNKYRLGVMLMLPSPRHLTTPTTRTAPSLSPTTVKAPSNAPGPSSPPLSHLKPAVPLYETVRTFPQFWFSKLRALTSTLVEVTKKMKAIEGMQPLPNTLDPKIVFDQMFK